MSAPLPTTACHGCSAPVRGKALCTACMANLRCGQGRTPTEIHEGAWWGLRLVLLAIVLAIVLASCPAGAP